MNGERQGYAKKDVGRVNSGGGRCGQVGRKEGSSGEKWLTVGEVARTVAASGDRWEGGGCRRNTENPRQASARQRQGTIRVFVGKYGAPAGPEGSVGTAFGLPPACGAASSPRRPGQDGCIEVMTPEAFEDMANDLIERQKRGELTLAELRTKASNAFAVAVDGQGRITIDRVLRSFAGIEPGSPAGGLGGLRPGRGLAPRVVRAHQRRRRPGLKENTQRPDRSRAWIGPGPSGPTPTI